MRSIAGAAKRQQENEISDSRFNPFLPARHKSGKLAGELAWQVRARGRTQKPSKGELSMAIDPLNPSLEEAFDAVAVLVKNFAESESHYLSATYSEAQVRKDFIDKLLWALGWDVNHDIQKNPYQQEVTVERAVQTAMAQRRADYSLSVAPHYETPSLYLEAKKPHEDIATADNYFQTIRYANQQGHAIGILTSFVQLHVIDCRYLANIDTALQYALQKYTYEELADPEKFRWLYYLLSRPAVIGGSIGRYAETLPKPKGRPGQKAFLPVAYKAIDDRLLETLDELRSDLARSLKNRNPQLESGELTELTQRILDRLVFIRFLEDKLIEPNPIIPTLGRSGGRSAWDDFLATSRRLDGIYNGIVFRRHALLDDPAALVIDDKHFTDLLDGFDFHKSKYLFNEIPLYILGSIYERFLGNVIVATTKRATLEPKPEVRKAGGVYYTPKYVADYIVGNTVGKLIAGKTPAEIAKMRFADIACGAGSFLLAVYDCLLKYVTCWYIEHSSKAPKEAIVKRDGAIRLSLTEKSRILLENIFGVDISPQAVEVAQLALYLKLLEDETTASARQYTLEFNRPLLPPLGDNIKCGNSLIAHDFYDTSQLALVDLDTTRRVRPFDWNAEFPTVSAAGHFDAVVGNPPYISIQTMNDAGPDEVCYFNKHYRSAGTGNYDIYVVFVERALALLRDNGLMGFILPSKFFATDYGKPLRRLLTEKKSLAEIVDFRHGQVFANAATYTCLLFLSRGANSQVQYATAEPPEAIRATTTPAGISVDLTTLSDRPWVFSPPSQQALLKKLHENSAELLGLPSKISRGSSTGNDDVFVLKVAQHGYATRDGKPVSIEKDILRTPIHATDFGRYRFNPRADERVIFPYAASREGYRELEEKELARRYPRAYAYLKERKNLLAKRKQFKKWYGFSAPRSLDGHLRAELMVPLLANKGLLCALPEDMRPYCPMASGGFTITVSDKQPLGALYVLGVLNSRLLYWYLEKISNRFRGGWITCTKQYVGTLPIRLVDLENRKEKGLHDRLVGLVEARLALQPQLTSLRVVSDKVLIERQIDAIERQIDHAVYELYGLDEAEIEIVEQPDLPLPEAAPVAGQEVESANAVRRNRTARAKKKSAPKRRKSAGGPGQKQIFD